LGVNPGSNCADRLARHTLQHSTAESVARPVSAHLHTPQSGEHTLPPRVTPDAAANPHRRAHTGHDKAPGYCLLPEGFNCSDAAACFSISPSSAQRDCGHCTVSVYSKLSCGGQAEATQVRYDACEGHQQEQATGKQMLAPTPAAVPTCVASTATLCRLNLGDSIVNSN
jgi:hypothetical protein